MKRGKSAVPDDLALVYTMQALGGVNVSEVALTADDAWGACNAAVDECPDAVELQMLTSPRKLSR